MYWMETDPVKDIMDTAATAGGFDTLVTAMKATGLAETLKGGGPFTIFAPTDEAFSRLSAETRESVLEDRAKLASLLAYHVVPGRYMASDVANVASAPSVQGQVLRFSTSPGVRVNTAHVLQADILTTNGVIHAIDKVLLPS